MLSNSLPPLHPSRNSARPKTTTPTDLNANLSSLHSNAKRPNTVKSNTVRSHTLLSNALTPNTLESNAFTTNGAHIQAKNSKKDARPISIDASHSVYISSAQAIELQNESSHEASRDKKSTDQLQSNQTSKENTTQIQNQKTNRQDYTHHNHHHNHNTHQHRTKISTHRRRKLSPIRNSARMAASLADVYGVPQCENISNAKNLMSKRQKDRSMKSDSVSVSARCESRVDVDIQSVCKDAQRLTKSAEEGLSVSFTEPKTNITDSTYIPRASTQSRSKDSLSHDEEFLAVKEKHMRRESDQEDITDYAVDRPISMEEVDSESGYDHEVISDQDLLGGPLDGNEFVKADVIERCMFQENPDFDGNSANEIIDNRCATAEESKYYTRMVLSEKDRKDSLQEQSRKEFTQHQTLNEHDIVHNPSQRLPSRKSSSRERGWWYEFVYEAELEREKQLLSTYGLPAESYELLSSRRRAKKEPKGIQNEQPRTDFRRRNMMYIQEKASSFKTKEHSAEQEALTARSEVRKIREKLGFDKVSSKFQDIPEPPARESLLSEQLQHRLSDKEKAQINYRIVMKQRRTYELHASSQTKATRCDSPINSGAMDTDLLCGVQDPWADLPDPDESTAMVPPPSAGVDMEYWKKRHELGDNIKVFTVCGNYEDIRSELIKRGWVENPDGVSSVFDFKWTTYASDVNFRKLGKRQIVNHFEGVEVLTTKLGLLKSLQQLVWHESEDYLSFYPRSYDLSDDAELQAFIDDYRLTCALSFVKCVQKEGSISSVLKFEQQLPAELLPLCESGKVETHIATLFCRACEYDIERKGLRDRFPDEIVHILESKSITPLSDADWDWLISIFLARWIIGKEQLEYFSSKTGSVPTKKPVSKKGDQILQADANSRELPSMQDLQSRIESIYNTSCSNRQSSINGTHGIWIVKPSGSSKGFGVRCLTDLKSILLGRTENARIVQKYIENPFLIKGRKFDIRQWVLVTSWDPLVIWFYEDCVLRFASEPFSLEDPENRFVHLCNYSIQKHNETGSGDTPYESAWTSDELIKYLDDEHGNADMWTEITKPMMKKIVTYAFRCCQSSIRARQNSFELYGVDFILDEHGSPWLMEVNSSPGLRASPALASQMLKDIVKVVVDAPLSRPGTVHSPNKVKLDSPSPELFKRGNSDPDTIDDAIHDDTAPADMQEATHSQQEHDVSIAPHKECDIKPDDESCVKRELQLSPTIAVSNDDHALHLAVNTGRWSLILKEEAHELPSMADVVKIVVEGHKVGIERVRGPTKAGGSKAIATAHSSKVPVSKV